MGSILTERHGSQWTNAFLLSLRLMVLWDPPMAVAIFANTSLYWLLLLLYLVSLPLSFLHRITLPNKTLFLKSVCKWSQVSGFAFFDTLAKMPQLQWSFSSLLSHTHPASPAPISPAESLREGRWPLTPSQRKPFPFRRGEKEGPMLMLNHHLSIFSVIQLQFKIIS